MAKIILFNKPFDVLTQFRPDGDRATLAQFIQDPSLRVAGRLDRDSEGLLLLTDDGVLNARITQPRQKQFKTYRVQVDGIPTCLLYTSPSPRDGLLSRMPSSA